MTRTTAIATPCQIWHDGLEAVDGKHLSEGPPSTLNRYLIGIGSAETFRLIVKNVGPIIELQMRRPATNVETMRI